MADVSDRRREPRGYRPEDGSRRRMAEDRTHPTWSRVLRRTEAHQGYEYPTDEKEEHPEAGLLADRPEKDWNNLRNTEDVKAIWDRRS